MAFDDGLVEVLDRNHDRLRGKKVLITGNITSLQILSQVKDMERAYILADNWETARDLSAMMGVKIGHSAFERADKKHVSVFFADCADQRFLDAIEEIDTFVVLLSKTKTLSQKQLFCLQSKLTPATEILLLGANAIGGKSADGLVKKSAKVVKVDSARKSTLFSAHLNEGASLAAPAALKTVYCSSLNLVQEHGVFSQGKLDEGTSLLLKAMHADLSKKEITDHLDLPDLEIAPQLDHIQSALDLGCGCGVIGLSLKKRGIPQVICSDISAAALHCTSQNAEKNGVDIKVLANNMLPDTAALDSIGISLPQGTFDIIATNPPFHEGLNRTTAPTLNMIAHAKDSLSEDGVMYLVGNTCLHYEDPLEEAFPVVEVLLKTTRFTVFKAHK